MATRKNLLTLEERKKIQILHENGATHSQISKCINRAASCVGRELTYFLKDGIYDAEWAHAKRTEMQLRRGPTQFVQEKKRQIPDLIRQGKSLGQIAGILGLAHISVSNFVKRDPELYEIYKNPSLSKKGSPQMDLFVSLLEKDPSSENPSHQLNNLDERISNLEMQIEIIINQLRGMKK